ncbi:MAG: DUF6625 family protein [Lachnospiraceae bacterium]
MEHMDVGGRILEKMTRIIIICCYFGKMPEYFLAWLMSCGWNLSIDFLLVTDQEIREHPPNVEIYKSSLEEIRIRAEHVLGFTPCLNQSYKLCDYKVLYGLMFQEKCQGYDFWGHCDLDMIFGDLRKFITENKLSVCDRIYPYGHLALYRNTEECNQRYRSDGSPYSYKQVFTSDNIYFFDERCYMKICEKNNYPCCSKIEMADIRCRYRRFRIHECLGNYKHQLFIWRKGKILRVYEQDSEIKEEEFPYIHFKRRKNMSGDIENTDCFAITNQGFIPVKTIVTSKIIREYNPYPGSLTEWWENFSYIIKSRIKHLRNKLG